jgi:spoIIIJ-associated protein
MTETPDSLEISADNVEDATAQGLFELGLEESEVDVEVLDEGDPAEGRPARVRLTVRPVESQPEDETVAAARATLQELLSRLRVRSRITASWADDEDRALVLNVLGDDLGMLIGHNGETLASLQYMTRVLAARRLGRPINVVVDVESFKSRRAEKLRKLALRMADQAVQQGRTLSLEPMPPNERRIIHLALRDRPDVTTESTGEGRTRKVTIIPKVQP